MTSSCVDFQSRFRSPQDSVSAKAGVLRVSTWIIQQTCWNVKWLSFSLFVHFYRSSLLDIWWHGLCRHPSMWCQFTGSADSERLGLRDFCGACVLGLQSPIFSLQICLPLRSCLFTIHFRQDEEQPTGWNMLATSGNKQHQRATFGCETLSFLRNRSGSINIAWYFNVLHILCHIFSCRSCRFLGWRLEDVWTTHHVLRGPRPGSTLWSSEIRPVPVATNVGKRSWNLAHVRTWQQIDRVYSNMLLRKMGWSWVVYCISSIFKFHFRETL